MGYLVLRRNEWLSNFIIRIIAIAILHSKPEQTPTPSWNGRASEFHGCRLLSSTSVQLLPSQHGWGLLEHGLGVLSHVPVSKNKWWETITK